jgi:hypothetical protein
MEIIMAIPKGKHQISISIDKEVYEDLVRIAQKLDMPVSKVARNVLYCGMDDTKLFEKIGLVKSIKLYHDFKTYINKKSFWLGHGAKVIDLDENGEK